MVISNVYESVAVEFAGDNFFNLVVGIDTEMPVDLFNTKLRDIEDKHGRRRNIPRFSSRTLDLDLLIYDGLVRHDSEIDVPREEIQKYAFVLRPLAEIAADLEHPESGISIRKLWEAYNGNDQDLWRVEFQLND
jgi:2-amino-4-hydroxy-6-hydroxymethyldihydropteridine diphosphokinase